MNTFEETVRIAPGAVQRAPRASLAVITVALVMSVTLNVLLARRVQSLTNAHSGRIAGRLLKIGTAVPPITVVRFDGQQEVISYQSATNQSTVLYVFTPPCTWCARNMDNLKALVEKESGQYRLIGLSLSDTGLGEYVAKNQLNLPVYSGLSAETLKVYKLGGTPQTIVVSPDGRVVQNWAGAYVGDQKSQIEAFFHVKLPGLRELQHENEKNAAEEKGQTAPQSN